MGLKAIFVDLRQEWVYTPIAFCVAVYRIYLRKMISTCIVNSMHFEQICFFPSHHDSFPNAITSFSSR